MTDEATTAASMTGVTGLFDITKQPLVTGDRSSQVRPYNARRKGEPEKTAHPSPDPPQLHLLPTDRYITDRAQLGRCRTCNQPVIRADLGARIHASADPTHLTPLDELQHKVAGHRTLELLPDTPGLGPPILRIRHLSEIRWRPGRGLPEHHCGSPPATSSPELLARLHPAPSARHDLDDQPTDPKAPF
jgi:hypothetical protein